ncbi:MAG: sel1 repeat family protein, partial [Sulfurimonas sp.]|nr:sel1 repeat family protein [Sulfurimonas sp.]
LVYMQLLKFDKAARWLEKDAANGDERAYYLLAEIYCEKEKFVKAKKWAKKSKESGNKDAELLWLKYNLDKF